MELEVISKIGKSGCLPEPLFLFMGNFDNFQKLLSPEQSDKFESYGDSCIIKLNAFAKLNLQIISKEENKLIKIGTSAYGKSMSIWIQLNNVGPYDTRIRIIIRSKTNLLLRWMMKKQLKKFIDNFVDAICAVPPHVLVHLANNDA